MEPQPPQSPQPPPPQAPARKPDRLAIGVVLAIVLGAVSLGYGVVSHIQDQQSAASSAAQTQGQLNWMRNTLASDNDTLAHLASADVSATSSYAASGCTFTTQQLFDISVTYANFGTTYASDTTFTITVHYSSGGSQAFTYLLGNVPGRYLGSFAKQYTLNSCNVVTSVYVSWTWL